MSKKHQLEEQLRYIEKARMEMQCPIEHDTLFGIYSNLQHQYREMTGRFFHAPKGEEWRGLRVERDGDEAK